MTTEAGRRLLADWDIIPVENRRAIIEAVEDEAAGRSPRYIWSPGEQQGDYATRAVAAERERIAQEVEELGGVTLAFDRKVLKPGRFDGNTYEAPATKIRVSVTTAERQDGLIERAAVLAIVRGGR